MECSFESYTAKELIAHVEQGGDAQPHLGCEESELTVPEKIEESFYWQTVWLLRPGLRQSETSDKLNEQVMSLLLIQLERKYHRNQSFSINLKTKSKVQLNFDVEYLNGCQILQIMLDISAIELS